MAATGRVRLGVVDRAHPLADLHRRVVPQLQGAVQQPQLLGVGMAAAGLDGGGEDGGQRLGGVMGLVPVAGQPGGADIGADQCGVGLQGLGVAAVDAGALAGEQVVDDGLADEGVPEAVARAVLGGHEGVAADGGPQRLDEVVLGHPADGGEEFVLDRGAALGGRAHHALGVLGERLDAHQQQIAQRVAEAVQSAVGEAAGQFLDEEGVALGALEDPVDGVLLGSAAVDPGDLGAHLRAGEAGQFDAADRAHPVDLGEEGAQRVAAVDVVRAVGRHQEDACVVQGLQEVGEQLAGGAVGPVEVLDDDDEGAVGGEALQEAGGQFEEAGAADLLVMRLAGCLSQFGQDAGEFALLAGDGGGQLVAQMPVEGVQDRGERARRAGPRSRSRCSRRARRARRGRGRPR